jgi:hypothetical protein
MSREELSILKTHLSSSRPSDSYGLNSILSGRQEILVACIQALGKRNVTDISTEHISRCLCVGVVENEMPSHRERALCKGMIGLKVETGTKTNCNCIKPARTLRYPSPQRGLFSPSL